MRKFSHFSAVLSLFLLVPASIIWAQVTKTLNGTVSYQSGMSESKFSTPNGDVTIHLPQSLSGAVITGTVSTQPSGKTEKEKRKNLDALLKMVVNLDGQKIPLSASPSNFDWLTHMDRTSRTPLELLNGSAVKIAELSLPPVLSAPAKVISGTAPRLTTSSNMLVKGDALNVYTDQQFTPGEKFVLTDSKGQQFTIKPLCLSSQQAVLTIPQGVVMGECTIREEIWNQPMSGYNVTSADFRLIDINLTSPNTNLRPGQESFVIAYVIVTDEKGEWINPDLDHWFGSVNIDLRNLNANTVTMEGGNLQRVYLGQTGNTGVSTPQNGSFQIRRSITGVKPGNFSVSATLHEDYTTSNDPFRPQLNVLKTPEDFNAWADALKKDLSQFAKLSDIDQSGQALKSNIQRAIDNIPACTSPEQLDECKAVAYSLIRPLNVPKGAANTWISSYEAFKSAVHNQSGTGTGGRELTNRGILENGLDFIERLSYRSGDSSLRNGIPASRELVQQIQQQGESEETVNRLNNDLLTIRQKTDEKLMAIPSPVTTWKLTDLLFSTYCIEKRTKDGIDPARSMIGFLDPDKKTLKVAPAYRQQVLTSLQAVPADNGTYRVNVVSETRTAVSYNVQLMPFVFANIFDGDWWAEDLIKKILKDTSRGAIIDTTRKSDGTWYIFYENAKCVKNESVPVEITIGCQKEHDYDFEKHDFKETGRFIKVTDYPTGTCKKGTEFCTEVYVVISSIQIFMDANCTRLMKTENHKDFSCL